MLSSLSKSPPNAQGVAPDPDPDPDPAAPLVSAWQVRASAGEPQAIVRVRNLQSAMAAGRDAWGRLGKPQPVQLSSEVSFNGPFETASARDAVDAGTDTVHYGTLSKTLLGGMKIFSGAALAQRMAGRTAETETVQRTADVCELLWVIMTGRVIDGRVVDLPPDQVTFLDPARLRSLALTLRLPKASLLGDGVSLTATACFKDASELVAETKMNFIRSYARCLRLHGLRVPTLIGVNSNERTAKQMVVVDVEIDRFDSQEDIYVELEKLVVATLEASSFETLEALGTHIANKILDDFRIGDSHQLMRDRGWQVGVCLEKPIAVPFADCPSVEVRVG